MSIQKVSSDTPTYAFRWKYDIFISFRGEDTRKNFTDHLYDALTQEGVIVFRDDEVLERGKPISRELLQAIEESRFSIIVFSRNYAFSTWCLDETAKIVDCKNTREQNVFPIFYDVDPSVVRKQTGAFGEAFAKHEETFSENKQKVQIWKNALTEVANLSGWDAKNRHESEFIKDIVKEISIKLSLTTLMTSEGLVGINSRLEELKLLIGTGSNDIRMIGICGMGGIDKTTIARVFHELFSHQFEGSAFLANVREISGKSGLVTFQRQLLLKILGRDNNICNEYDGIKEIKRKLSYRKVLVVVDDVDHIDQLNNLVGKREWFGLGSRIIITTRNKHLLMSHEVDEIYEAKELNHDEALELLIWKAFKNKQPLEDYLKLSQRVIRYVGSLPLALEVLGSFLFGRTAYEWMGTIKRLERDSNKEILDKLQISFDTLEETEKKIFLDLACFFKGDGREYVIGILDGCGFNPTIGISVLLDKSLIKISDFNTLEMHDLLQEMGRQIVKRECIEEPGKRSRLWDKEDIRHVLTKNTGTELVEVIILEEELHLNASAKAFSKMINLRLLKIRNVQLPKGLEYLSNELRLLDWDGYSLKTLPSNLQLNKLVELKMGSSRIGQLWKGNKPLYMLKSMSFEDCTSLIKTPDFTEIPNIEELTLTGCSSLCEIHPSLLLHKRINCLDLGNCSSLKTLPSKIHMESLTSLQLYGCSKLKKFPEIIGSMECLSDLSLSVTAIKELPLSIEFLSGLDSLDLEGCKNLLSLPSTINGLRSLRKLDLSYCSKLVSLPSTINDLKSLKALSLSHCSKLVTLPSSINGLKSLEKLFLTNCFELVSLPNTINGLESLTTLSLSGCSKLESLPETLWQVESLRTLSLRKTAIRQQVSSYFAMKNLLKLDLCGCKVSPSKSSFKKSSNPRDLILPASLPVNVCSLTQLDLSHCNLGEETMTSDLIGSFISVEDLDLSLNKFVSLPATINRLSKLRVLELNGCFELQILPELPPNICRLKVNCCVSLETLSNALRLCNSNLSDISCQYCVKLLDGRGEALSILKEYLKATGSRSYPEFGIVVPGSEVPEWLKHKSDGCSLIIEKPPDFNNNNKLAGYIVCSNFFVRKIDPALTFRSFLGLNLAYCNVTENLPLDDPFDIQNLFRSLMFTSAMDYVVGLPELDHLWLFYLSEDKIKEFNEPKFSISSLDEDIFVVKRIGVHPVYENEDFVEFH